MPGRSISRSMLARYRRQRPRTARETRTAEGVFRKPPAVVRHHRRRRFGEAITGVFAALFLNQSTSTFVDDRGRFLMKQNEDEIVDLLTKILRVLAFQVSSGTSVTDGARALKFAGLDNQMIADVLNTSPATVRSLTANLRAKRPGGRRR